MKYDTSGMGAKLRKSLQIIKTKVPKKNGDLCYDGIYRKKGYTLKMCLENNHTRLRVLVPTTQYPKHITVE